MKPNILKFTLVLLVLSAPVLAQDVLEEKAPKKQTSQAKALAQKRADARAARIKAKAQKNAKRLDINSATKEQLKEIPGLGPYADKIIAGRPYLTKTHLVTNGVLPEGVFLSIRDRIAAHQNAKPDSGR